MIRRVVCRTACATLILVPTLADAAWKGEASAGLLTTSGNSETQSINAKFVVDYLAVRWKNHFSAAALNNGDEQGTSAERYTVGDQLDYNFNPQNYMFGAVDYEKDLFGASRERVVETLGYGRHILTGPVHTLDAELGAGARQTVEQETRERQDEFIGRFTGKYGWKISPTSAFSQALRVESGAQNTFSETISELKLSIIGDLFLSLSFTLRNNTDVPPQTKKTDTLTAVSVAYSFGSS